MGLRVSRRRIDNGGEYTGKEIQEYCLCTGTRHEFASTHTSRRIGVFEQDGGIIAAMTCCPLKDRGLPSFLWGEQTFIATHLLNHVPHAEVGMVTP